MKNRLFYYKKELREIKELCHQPTFSTQHDSSLKHKLST